MRPLSQLALACLVFAASALAQGPALRKSWGTGDQASNPAAPAALEFSKPQVVEGVTAGSMLAGRFDCDNGSIYTLLAGSAPEGDPDSHLALMAIHPNGTTTSFSWWSVLGLSDISMPKAVFVGNGHVYVLVISRSATAENEHASRYPVVLIFNRDGELEDTVRLEEDWIPLAFGVFPSGNILLASDDRLNHRMDLSLVDKHGRFVRQISLEDNDFVARAAQMPPADRDSASYSPIFLIAMSKFLPMGDHLLLAPLDTGDLPILELDEHGVLGATTPHLPPGMLLEGFISWGASAFTVRLGKLLEPRSAGPHDSEGRVFGVATEPSQQMTEISRTDGRVLREIDLGAVGIQPACEANGVYHLLTSGNEQRLQIVTARLH